MGICRREDKSGEVCETLHILNPNPHSESRCLDHTSVDDSFGSWNWKVGQHGNSLWIKMKKYQSSWRKLLLIAGKYLYWAFQILPQNLETHLIKPYLGVQNPDALNLDNQTALLVIFYIKENKMGVKKGLVNIHLPWVFC